jgi:hypothetical protein
MPMSPLQTVRRMRRHWLPLVLGALLFAQMLGLVHRIAHPSNAAAAVLAAPADDVQALFDGHDDTSTCRLYDQLMHADLAVDAPQVCVVAPHTPLACATPPGWQLAAQAAGFLARGPPSRG